MAIISPNTFDPLRRYVGVRLAQGVPLADADWNEAEDVRRFELRAFLKWYVGEGVPAGNDGFRITPTNSTTTFTITAGGSGIDAFRAGRILVDGLEAFTTVDVDFAVQPLHVAQPGAAALAAAWGVPVIAAIPAPPGGGTTRTLAVCIDVWERLVTQAEDPSLVLPGLGTETCSRLRREWAVRVRTANSVPVSGDPDLIAGHSYALLAVITQTSAGTIGADAVVDKRRRGVSLPSQMDYVQTMADTFGAGYTVDGTGVPKLAFPIRDIVNSMLRERPAVVGPFPIQSGGPQGTPTAVIDNTGTPWVFWVRASGPDLFLSFTRRVAGVWTAGADAFQITGVLNVNSLAAGAQPDGTIRVLYSGLAGTNRILCRRFAGTWGAEEIVDTGGDNTQLTATVDPAGTIIAAWLKRSGGGGPIGIASVQTIRYPLGGAPGAVSSVDQVQPLDPGVLSITIDPTGAPQLICVTRPQGAFINEWPVFSRRFLNGAWEGMFTDTTVTLSVDTFIELAVGPAADGSLWAFWSTRGAPGFSVLRGKRVAAGSTETRDLLGPGQTPRFPAMVVDTAGNASLFFQNGTNLQQVALVQHI